MLSSREVRLLAAAKSRNGSKIERRKKTGVSFDRLVELGYLTSNGRITKRGCEYQPPVEEE